MGETESPTRLERETVVPKDKLSTNRPPVLTGNDPGNERKTLKPKPGDW